MWRHVDLVWTYVSEERITFISRVENSASEEPAEQLAAAHAGSSLADFFYAEDGGDTFLRNVGSHRIYLAPHPRRRRSS
jgi:hypothetical protein